jgi:hypothetical protein
VTQLPGESQVEKQGEFGEVLKMDNPEPSSEISEKV